MKDDDLKEAPGQLKKDTLVIRYIGSRPFRQSAEDSPVLPGTLIDADHVYALIRQHLLARADFVEVENG